MIKLYNNDCLIEMKNISDNHIDLTVTSPPYDNLRTYNNSLEWGEYIWKPIIKELYRITKSGGVVVWIVNDATIEGSETGTSFKQALYFKEVGFNLHDTMIWIKNQIAFPQHVRYHGAFEYMFIFSKDKLKTFNPICDRVNNSFGRSTGKITERQKDGTLKERESIKINEFSRRFNYWLLYNQSRGEENKHPAVFPEQLANDHIISWSNENDIVFDPFMGSGTTGKMAVLNNRNFIGIEKDETYFNIAVKRIQEAKEEINNKLF